MRGADHRPGSSPVQPPAERSPRPPSGVRDGSPPEQRVWDQGRQHEQPDHEKHAHSFILTRSPKLTHFATFRAGRKSGPRAHSADTSARTSSRRASRTRRPTRSPDPISSYWAAEAPAFADAFQPARGDPRPDPRRLRAEAHCPRHSWRPGRRRRRGTLGGRAKSLVHGRSAFHVENRPRLTAATARRNEQPRARGRNGHTVAFQLS